MHDPMVVAHEIVLPIPRRKWPARKKRWHFGRMRRTNPENLGEPVYPWWRPAGWECVLAGMRIGLYHLATIWHNEPRGADSGTYCKHYDHAPDGRWLRSRTGWKWHVHHWSIQVHPWQALRRWIFDRCAECGMRFPYGYSPIGFSWDPPRPPWWAFWRGHKDLHHDRCASLRSARNDMAIDREVIRALVAELSLRAGETEVECARRLYKRWEFRLGYRLIGVLGYAWNDEHTELVCRAHNESSQR